MAQVISGNAIWGDGWVSFFEAKWLRDARVLKKRRETEEGGGEKESGSQRRYGKKWRNEVNIGYLRTSTSLKLLDCIRMASHSAGSSGNVMSSKKFLFGQAVITGVHDKLREQDKRPVFVPLNSEPSHILSSDL